MPFSTSISNAVQCVPDSYLQISPKDKPVILCYNLMTPFVLVELFSEILFITHNVSAVYYFLGNTLPLYTFPGSTGLVLDCGYYCVQCLGVVKGDVAKNTFTVCSTGAFFAKNATSKILREENPGIKLTPYVVEDAIARYGVVLTLAQKAEFLGKEENVAKMKAKRFSVEAGGVTLNVSFFARAVCGEALFGDYHEEEANVAYSALQSLTRASVSARAALASKMVISGGTAMLAGFKRRLVEEMKDIVGKEQEFSDFACKTFVWHPRVGLKDFLFVQSSAFPPNILHWAGASILGSIKRIDKLGVTKEEFVKNGKEVKDRYWELLHATNSRAAEFIEPSRPTHTRRGSSVAYKKKTQLSPLAAAP